MTLPCALIAEDEPLLARTLAAELSALWPALRLLPPVHDGVAAMRCVREARPDIVFLDINMPGASGLDVARECATMAPPPHVVFITAFDRYAVDAFEHAAVDYLLKPVQRPRLEATVARLQALLDRGAHALPQALAQAMQQLSTQLRRQAGETYLRFVKASTGREVRIVSVDEVCYFAAADKYVCVVTADAQLLIRASMKELAAQLDPARFWQVHRGTVVNIDHVASARPTSLGRMTLTLRTRPETLSVSRQYAHLFRQM